MNYLLPIEVDVQSRKSSTRTSLAKLQTPKALIHGGGGRLIGPTDETACLSETSSTKEHWDIRAGTSYLLTKHFSLIGQWHSQFGWGGGLRWQF